MNPLKITFVFILFFTFIGCVKDPEITETSTTAESNLYSFYVAGHSYGDPSGDNVGVHPPFKDKFDFLNSNEFIDLGVFTGDIVRSPSEQSWDEIDADLLLLDHPVHFAVGNHDMYDRELYESRYGITYKSFVHESDLFIMLDPNIDYWNISGDQLQFLEDVLDKNHQDVDNIFVFFHQLLWWTPDNIFQNIVSNSLENRDDTINFWSEIEPLFSALPNNTYMFAGDLGANTNADEFMYHNYDNITFIGSGMGEGERDNIVMAYILEDKTVSFRTIALNGDDILLLGEIEDYILP